MPSYGPVETSTRQQLRNEGILLGQWGLAQAAVQLARKLDGEADTGRYARGVATLERTLTRLVDMTGRRPAAALPARSSDEDGPPPDAVDELAVKRDRTVS